jgi:carbamoyltransferase
VKSKFKNIHCPPFPNDTGLAVGMGLYHWHHIHNIPKMIPNRLFNPYLGPEYKKEETLDLLEKSKYSYKELTIEDLTEVLLSRAVICVAKGRSESGPRALGHRSIMCIPDTEYGRDYLNDRIKKREWYRPYAPIILDKYVDQVLEDYLPVSPYMSTSGIIKEEWRERLDAVNHVDNSTRPQIITEEQEPFIYKLIENIYDKTGIPVLLNTSFNMQEPIVETPEQALNTFAKFDIDYLVLHDWLVKK